MDVMQVAQTEFELTNHPLDDVRAAWVAPTINVYVHNIHASNGSGGATSAQITNQFNVLNAAYAGVAKFQIVSTDNTNNDSYYTATPWLDGEKKMKNALHKGTRRRPQHVLQQHGSGPARLGDVPVGATRAARRWTAS